MLKWGEFTEDEVSDMFLVLLHVLGFVEVALNCRGVTRMRCATYP